MRVDEARLSAAQAAWLLRVNDDTVRKWFGSPGFPLVAGSAVPAVSYDDLRAWCAESGKQAPLPADLLSASPERVRVIPDHEAIGGPHGLDVLTQLTEMEAEVIRYRSEAAALRRALREKIAGSTHARGDAAAADRALTHLLDAVERDAQ